MCSGSLLSWQWALHGWQITKIQSRNGQASIGGQTTAKKGLFSISLVVTLPGAGVVCGRGRLNFQRISSIPTMKLRFTIRDLLWLTALLAMGFGW